jgi:hypothetical protein
VGRTCSRRAFRLSQSNTNFSAAKWPAVLAARKNAKIFSQFSCVNRWIPRSGARFQRVAMQCLQGNAYTRAAEAAFEEVRILVIVIFHFQLRL